MAKCVVTSKCYRVLIGAGVVVVLAMGGWVSAAITGDTPTFVGGASACYAPDYMIDKFVREHNGLPKESVDLLDLPDTLQTYPVKHWTVSSLEVTCNWRFRDWLLHGSGAYHIGVMMQVVYADGTYTTSRWDSWRYGHAIGNLVICGGDGPPGTFTVTALRQ